MSSTKHLRQVTFLLITFILFQACQKSTPTELPQPQAVPSETQNLFLSQQTGPHVLADPDYFVWGLATLRWTDGKIHGYYARWPREYGFGGWLTHCEIAHAVADQPEGPFRTTGTVLASRNLDGWDRVNSHNPAVCMADGKIYLYYISNDFSADFQPTENQPFPSDEWLVENRREIVRNRQCIGVAMADQPAGPFTRHPEPVVVPHGSFKNIAVNPAVGYRDGRFVMIAKGDDVRHEEWFRIQLVGHSNSPTGPFTFQEEAIYDQAQTEDACIWYDQKQERFHSLVHVMGKPELARLISENGQHWREAVPFTFMQKSFTMDDGSVWKPQRVERPFVLTDVRGRAEWIYLAVLDGETSGNIAVPLKY